MYCTIDRTHTLSLRLPFSQVIHAMANHHSYSHQEPIPIAVGTGPGTMVSAMESLCRAVRTLVAPANGPRAIRPDLDLTVVMGSPAQAPVANIADVPMAIEAIGRLTASAALSSKLESVFANTSSNLIPTVG